MSVTMLCKDAVVIVGPMIWHIFIKQCNSIMLENVTTIILCLIYQTERNVTRGEKVQSKDKKLFAEICILTLHPVFTGTGMSVIM